MVIGGSMEKAKELWGLVKTHKKISITVAVVIVVIYFLVN